MPSGARRYWRPAPWPDSRPASACCSACTSGCSGTPRACPFPTRCSLAVEFTAAFVLLAASAVPYLKPSEWEIVTFRRMAARRALARCLGAGDADPAVACGCGGPAMLRHLQDRGFGGRRARRRWARGPRSGWDVIPPCRALAVQWEQMGADDRLSQLVPRRSSRVVRETISTWSPVTESNRRPSPYHLVATRSMLVVGAGHGPMRAC
jgi:hypothetical protein